MESAGYRRQSTRRRHGHKGAAPALVDLLAGQIQMTFSTMATSGAHIRNGKVRAVAITGVRRSSLYPDLPTVSEAGVPGFELHNTYGYYAPAGTPRSIITAVNSVVSLGMNAPETVKALAMDGNEVLPPMSPDEFNAKFEREYAELEKLIKALNITLN